MAKPQWHVVPTAICAGLAYSVGDGWEEVAAVSFSGFFLDFDHLSFRRIKNLFEGRWKEYIPGWIDYFHTWQAAVVIIALCAVMGWWYAVASYALHILTDGANSENFISHEAPLPEWLFRFYPAWLTYRSGL